MTRYTECMAQVAVTSEPLDVHALTRGHYREELVRLKPDTTDDEESVRLKPDAASGATDGAIATFTGLVRDHNQGRRVRFLDAKRMRPRRARCR